MSNLSLDSLRQEQIEHRHVRRALRAQGTLHGVPQVRGLAILVGSHDVQHALLSAILLRVYDARLIRTGAHEGVVGQPEGAVWQRGCSTALQASLAIVAGVDEALVPWVLGEVGVDVVLHRKALAAPGVCSDCLCDVDHEETELGIAPPQTRQERTSSEGLHHGLQGRVHGLTVGGQCHCGVPCPDLVHEAVPGSGVDLALLWVAVLASHDQLRMQVVEGLLSAPPTALLEKVLVLAHEGQEGCGLADAVDFAVHADVLQIARQGHGCVQFQAPVEASTAVQADHKHSRPEDPRGLPQLGVLGMLRQEERQDEDLREVCHQALVLTTAEPTCILEDISSEELRRDVLDGLSCRPARPASHKVLAGSTARRGRADVRKHILHPTHASDGPGIPIVVTTRRQTGIRQGCRASLLTNPVDFCRLRALRDQQERTRLTVPEARVSCTSCYQIPQGHPELASQRRMHFLMSSTHRWHGGGAMRNSCIQNAAQAIVIADCAGTQQSFGSDKAHLPSGIADILLVAELVSKIRLVRPRNKRLASRSKRIRTFQKVILDPIGNELARHGLAAAAGASALCEACVGPTGTLWKGDLDPIPGSACRGRPLELTGFTICDKSPVLHKQVSCSGLCDGNTRERQADKERSRGRHGNQEGSNTPVAANPPQA
mmetsp:Transcript_89663/g.256905  ORF Transcript_89663/g.256905 Transcript_89663/m.256905 type:complete len:659 (-) Transcript_89663:12-1988(-)